MAVSVAYPPAKVCVLACTAALDSNIVANASPMPATNSLAGALAITSTSIKTISGF